MAETGTEYTGYMIIFALTAAVLLLVFAFIGIDAYASAHGNLCLASSLIRNFYYKDLCFPSIGGLGSPFCLTSTLSGIGLMPPLMCPTQFASYGGNTKASDIWDQLSSIMINCLNQYGFSSNLQVSYNSPLFCGGVNIDVPYNLTLSSFFNYLSSKNYSSTVDSCLYNSNVCPSGFSCDTSNPSLCEKTVDNYTYCSTQSNYVATSPGYSIKVIPLNASGTSAANNMSNDLCNAAEGCTFNKSVDECTSSNTQTVCSQPWKDFCFENSSGWFCHVQYSPSLLPSFLPPLSCNAYTPITKKVNVTYFDYLNPGGLSIYFFYNTTSGSAISGSDAINEVNISHSKIYVYYLNSFTGSHLPPNSYNSPPGCPSFTIYNSISSSCFFTECVRSFAIANTFTTIPSTRTAGIVFLTAAAAGEAALAYSSHEISGSINTYLNYANTKYSQVLYTTLFQTTGFQQCLSCIWNSMMEHISNGIILGGSRLLVCIDV